LTPNPLLFYARHGETAWNIEGRLQGHRDSDLTALGRAQAVTCGEVLRDLLARDGLAPASLDYVASPLGRARATMERMRTTLGLEAGDYRTDARLAELAYGRWEGMTYAELLAREPETLEARERDKWNFVPPGGESYAQLLARVAEWHVTVRRNSMVVAHGGTVRVLMVLHGIMAPEAAASAEIEHGVLYVFGPHGMARYG